MHIPYGGRVYDLDRGYALMEWVGEKSPMDQEWVRYSLITNRFTPEQADLIRHVARHACVRVDGRHRRIMRRGNLGYGGIDGLSVDEIIWGARVGVPVGSVGSYVQVVSVHDADLILSTPSGMEFVLYTEDGARHQGDDQPLALIPDISVRVAQPNLIIQTRT